VCLVQLEEDGLWRIRRRWTSEPAGKWRATAAILGAVARFRRWGASARGGQAAGVLLCERGGAERRGRMAAGARARGEKEQREERACVRGEEGIGVRRRRLGVLSPPLVGGRWRASPHRIDGVGCARQLLPAGGGRRWSWGVGLGLRQASVGLQLG
jgi:hypothetical protein